MFETETGRPCLVRKLKWEGGMAPLPPPPVAMALKEKREERTDCLNRQVKGKDMKKLSRAPPSTPTKRADLVKSLLKSLSPKTKQKVTNNNNNNVPYNILSEETTKLVSRFYQDDSVSRTMPGKNNVLSATDNNGTKMKKRKRLLLDDISEVQKKYLKGHPENSIGKNKFFKLQLLWVIPVNKHSQEVCQFVYHENVDMILEALQNKARAEHLKITDYQKISNAYSMWSET